MLMSFLTHFAQLLMESAPWLLLGFFIAGLIKALIPTAWMHKHLGNNKPMTVIKSALIGAPLPLCSCGVIPAAMGLRRAGASKSSTTAFLIATPETGVDSVSITYAFMGWFMALVRPIAAICSAIMAGLIVRQLDLEPSDTDKYSDNTGCCSSKTESADNHVEQGCCSSNVKAVDSPSVSTGCCSSKTETADSHEQGCCSSNAESSTPAPTGWLTKIQDGLRYSILDLSKDVAKWLIIGLVLAALIRTFVPTEWLAQWGHGLQAFVVMALIGVPMYICATASTPIAASLLFAGVSPGAVLVFMLVGPATNIATLSLVKQELGGKSLVAYLSSIVLVSFVFGWAVNALTQQYDLLNLQMGEHAMGYSTFSVIASVLLSVLLVRGLWIKLKG